MTSLLAFVNTYSYLILDRNRGLGERSLHIGSQYRGQYSQSPPNKPIQAPPKNRPGAPKLTNN
ncbi:MULTISPECIES: hypothetical protein [Oscillatoriales]|uniref:hypothetical protein n=1 Tax=Oscillatoriales TaxID=1150 RepID=UPI0001C38FBD|nr:MULTISPECIES: hypothetical protein [Arthrospira]AMW26679.1 hypothetical protein AP285_00375 [Arthrospira platensis YZ]KDR56322.1 hypothetical protein APPUASWS_017290 [Arthrospira platensis str. Paraca]MBD2667572.1 hypothetical protein [Arthrospira platensis FACHB-439]MDF2209077.1 hypothetical protein [Arthrospira platensis NCB002]MDT9181192.1 hypothetical protein [Limnospira sp. PMC 289.06]MDT9293614.1 hypothetical protein [Arthrospira platensis PCC 7345]MDT9308868.1 hypothetical protein 